MYITCVICKTLLTVLSMISVSPVYTVIFLVLFCPHSGINVAMNIGVNPINADIVAYEFYRTNNCRPEQWPLSSYAVSVESQLEDIPPGSMPGS